MVNRYQWWEKVLIYGGTLLFLTFILAPFIEAFVVSLRPIEAVFRVPYKFISEDMSFDAYARMWESVPRLGRFIFNSLFIASCATALALFCIIPAAYSLSRFAYRGRNAILAVLLVVSMMGAAVLIIPLYKLMLTFGLLNSYAAMIVPGATFLIPMGIFLMRTYFMSIPAELEEAAIVDGAGRLYILWRIILPVSLPGMMVVAIMVFIGAYSQQFLFALTFNSTLELNPLPIGLYQFFGRSQVLWNELMAASLVGISPVLLIYVFLQKYIVAGLTSGAVKE